MKIYSKIIIIISTIIYLYLLITMSNKISVYILDALERCINVIIPSLYIFMITSDFIITSNIYILLGKPFSVVSRFLFKIPDYCFPIYIISNIGGYPVGARLISDMVKENKLDHNTAKYMLTYCYLSGPAFILGIVGNNIFSDTKIGMLIFISTVITNFLIAIIIGWNKSIPEASSLTPKVNINAETFIKSISNGGKSIFNICTIIIFFSSLICMIDNCGIAEFLSKIIDKYTSLDYADGMATIKSIIEISNITLFEPKLNNIPIITSVLSLGGICIIFQIKSITTNITLKHFLIFRIIAMLLSYLICKILYFMSYNFLFTSYSPAQLSHGQNSPIMTLFLLIMTILILLKFSMENNKKI